MSFLRVFNGLSTVFTQCLSGSLSDTLSEGFSFFLISTGLYRVFLQSLSTEVSLPSGIRSKSILGDFKTTSTRYPYDQGTF